MIYRSIILVAILFAFLASTSVIAQQQIIYPAEGQSVEQQQKDESECYVWAKEQTGYDPVQGTQYAAPPQQDVGGERLGGAARGAAGGAIIGALAGNAGKGAAIGAVGGTVLGGAKRRGKEDENQQAMAQQQQAIAQQQQNYQRAYTACFEGRGYTVR